MYFFETGGKAFCLADWRMKRHRQHSDRTCLCMTSVSVSQSKYNKIWKCERLASTSGPFERSPLMSYHFRNNSWQCIIIENWLILNNLVKNKSKVANCAACINDSGFFASVALRTVHYLKIFLCLYELGLHPDVMEIGGSVGEGTECPTLNRVDTVSVETMVRPREVIRSTQKTASSTIWIHTWKRHFVLLAFGRCWYFWGHQAGLNLFLYTI